MPCTPHDPLKQRQPVHPAINRSTCVHFICDHGAIVFWHEAANVQRRIRTGWWIRLLARKLERDSNEGPTCVPQRLGTKGNIQFVGSQEPQRLHLAHG